LRDQNFDKIPYKSFDWDFDDIELDRVLIQTLIYKESLNFHPENPEIENTANTTKVQTEKIITRDTYPENITPEITTNGEVSTLNLIKNNSEEAKDQKDSLTNV
jgi:hypothetical protein